MQVHLISIVHTEFLGLGPILTSPHKSLLGSEKINTDPQNYFMYITPWLSYLGFEMRL